MTDVLCVGHAAFDITMAVTRHPSADEKMQADALDLAGGGPAANAAVQIARLGGSAAFCGYLGRDIFGDAHLAELRREGVDVSPVVRGGHPTPVSQILAKPDGARSVVNFRGRTPHLPADVLRPAMPKAMLFDGHEPLVSEALCHQAGKAGVPTVLDAGSVHTGTRRLAPVVDVLAASEKFARQWSGETDMEKALDRLLGVNACVVITLGERGLLWARDGERGTLPAFGVQAVDSTGAGDAFHGALALAMARGTDWQQTLRLASATGALTCTRLGARAALPDLRAVETLLRRQ